MPSRQILPALCLMALAGCSKTDPTAHADAAISRDPAAATPGAPTASDLDPNKLKAEAPEVFRAKFETSKGPFTIQVTRAWAPRGADRFYNLVKSGYYKDVRFFRVLRSPRPFMAQFGIHGDPNVSRLWRDATIPDDPVQKSNKRGFVTFATSGPNSRTTQVFINYSDNANLDTMGFAPFGEVTDGMNVVDSLYAEYGEGKSAPNQGRMQIQGNQYLSEGFPSLDYITNTTIL